MNPSRHVFHRMLIALGMALSMITTPVQASSTDLSTVPLITSSSTDVKPNIMFILDDSGSMSYEFMPDDGNFNGKYGHYSAQCNGLAYNPAITYTPPVTYLGVSFGNASISAAWQNGFSQSSGSTSLSNAYYYSYSGTQTTAALKTYNSSSSTFYRECNSAISSTPGSSVFTKVFVSNLTSTQQTNYANWYSYYRSRLLSMKSSAGLAFQALDNRYRVGFMTINNNGGKDLLNISDFDSSQKSAWYSKLYAASASGSTPTRSALAIAGRIYANKISSYNAVSVTDPMEYSCQQNFSIMATDGFWNSGSCNNGSAGCYNNGAGTLFDGSTSVGNQDYSAIRPYYDGSGTVAVVTSKTITTTVSQAVGTCSINSGNGRGPGNGNTTSGYQLLTTTTVTTQTVVTTAGIVSSDSTSQTSSTSKGSCTTSQPTPAGTITTVSDPISSTSISGTNIADTMADVAYYYYVTDLRTADNGNATGVLGVDVASNNVSGNSKDPVAWQHMTTFTLGLGVNGYMQYSTSYDSDTSGDYYNVKIGNKNATGSSSTCSWASAGATCNWPKPSGDESNIDDLWHAAVNGRGTYYSAADPAALTSGLSSALSNISARLGGAAAATTSNPNVTTGDNYVFNSTFVSADWYGELVRQTIDLTTGAVADIDDYPCSSSICDWSAQTLLDAKVAEASDTRTLYTYDPNNTYSGNSTRLKSFTWSNLSSSEKTYFNAATISTLSQYSDLSTTNQTAAAGENLVNFLRGQRGFEGTLYRSRSHILGDIVSSEATYLKAPQFSYTDAGYSSFKSSHSDRTAMVYVGANDGMLHAFNADSGAETWAYTPSLIMPNLYRLADTNYANNHRFYVDGTATIGDICTAACSSSANAVWKTILVAGLGGGGRGYYALDITDPASPKALWEFTSDTSKGTGYLTDEDMGYSYGNPVITKNSDGNWIVLLTSGYNNVNPGSGGGYLFAIDAASGSLLTPSASGTTAGKLATGTGSTGSISGICSSAPCPSGLARINAWADSGNTDNSALRVYGGDLFGNLWRFDINNTLGQAGYDVQHLATFTAADGTRQPITAKPELGLINDTYAAVFVGTGKFLGTTDIVDTTAQSFYAIKDPLDTTDWGIARDASIVAQALTTTTNSAGATIRTATSKAVDWSGHIGWYIDLPSSGERANTDPTLVLGTLVFTTNLPGSSACTVGGSSWIYLLNYTSGSATAADGAAGQSLGNVLSTRPQVISLPSGSIVSLTRTSDGKTITTPVNTSGSASDLRRINWRELISDQ